MPEKLKKGWTRVAFGDVVEKVNETGVPTGDESRTYIGLEHLDSDSFTVSRWGSEVDLVVPKTRIKKGDVLFARRNTHLKRCAVAPFEAYFSPDGYAFRSKSPALLHELLLYIVASDGFMSYAIEHSAGTHSKRVKWTDLMRYEFALPPLDEQRRIAEVLSVVRVLDDSLAMLEESCARVLASAAAYEFDQIRNASATMVPLINICSQGPQSGIYKSEDFRGRGVLMVNMGELFGNDIIDSTVKMQRVCLDEKELLRYTLTPNDLLFGRRSVVLEGAGRCVRVGDMAEPVVFESSVLRATIDSELADSRYVFEWIRSPYGHQQMRRIVTYTTVSGVAGSAVARLPVPFPSLQIQKGIAERLSLLRCVMEGPKNRRASYIKFASTITQKVLGGAT